MLYNVTQIAKILNINKVTAFAKLKIDEVRPLVIKRDGKTFVNEKGLKAIKDSLNYNQNTVTKDEIAASTLEIDIIKEDIIDSLKTHIEFLKEQINVKDQQISSKDNQIQKNNQLFENTQVLFKNEQEKNTTILTLPETIKEHDIELVNTLTTAMKKQKEAFLIEQMKRKKGIFSGIFKSKK